ncbi:MAG: hypothetical protein ACREEZ_13825 [Stellaceae bacterium]
MSKIPQGEWSAIAARYQNGESISNIARGYSCTPPAIHYILKRYRQLPAAADRPPTALVQTADAGGEAILGSGSSPVKFDRLGAAPALVRTRAPVATQPPSPAMDRPPADQPAEHPHAMPTPGLDSDLHHRAETAIAMFRTSFDAALTEGSPGMLERLRQAAADLMRVAARTTIVLDRLSASSERAARAPDYPRSAHAR